MNGRIVDKRQAVGRLQGGVTLVELLAALLVSALVVVIASRIFLSGNQQFLARILESDRLAKVYLLKGAVQHSLRNEITRCDAGRLWMRVDGKELEMQDILKAKFPELKSADFTCWEKSSAPITFLPWKDRYQPVLLEYRVVLAASGSLDTLAGSWLK